MGGDEDSGVTPDRVISSGLLRSGPANGVVRRPSNDGILWDATNKPTLWTKIAAIALPLSIALVSNFTYMACGGIAQKKYLEFVEDGGGTPSVKDGFWADDRRLPDLLLDVFEQKGLHSSHDSLMLWTKISDVFPQVIGFACLVYLTRRQKYVLANRLMLTQSFLVLLNSVAENITVLPSSYGYDRCLAYLDIEDSSELTFGITPTGSCAAMIWSGHIVNMLIPAHVLGCALEEDYWKGPGRRICGVVKPKTFLMVFLGLIEALILLAARGHYSVDMMLGIMLALLTLTNKSLATIFLLANPFVASMIDPEELELLKMPHEALRNRVRSIRTEAVENEGGGNLSVLQGVSIEVKL
mmetsp:Transcript_47221/g.92139  ORF Transcript_47221/g.92139 Transcript_47221/m.92139 type:complete len:355 (-) Transcript_47221:13-1077(-)